LTAAFDQEEPINGLPNDNSRAAVMVFGPMGTMKPRVTSFSTVHLKEAPKNDADRQHRRDNDHLDASAGVDGVEAF